MSGVRLGFIKGFDDEMYWIHFIFKIFLCFQNITNNLENSDSQKYAGSMVVG